MNREIEILSPPYIGNSSWPFQENKGAKWTPEENKLFENALALFDKDTPDRWYNVAKMIPGKTVNDVIRQYRELVEDVSDIEAGLIPIPGYAASSFTLEWVNNQGFESFKQIYGAGSKRSSSARTSDHERKKGVPWTEEEHRQFLLGLKKYGKGDWRSISRNFVTTRTPTQVASHAQKYFIRQLSGGKDKRRSSIHDITTVNLSESTKSPPPGVNGTSSPDKLTQPHHRRNPNGDIGISSNDCLLPKQEEPNVLFDYPSSNLSETSLRGTSSNYGLKVHEQNLHALHPRGHMLEDFDMIFQAQSMLF